MIMRTSSYAVLIALLVMTRAEIDQDTQQQHLKRKETTGSIDAQQSIRSSVRQLQVDGEAEEEPTTIECIPYLIMSAVEVQGVSDDGEDEDQYPDDEWVCETFSDEDSFVPQVYKLDDFDPQYFIDNDIRSGESILRITRATKHDGWTPDEGSDRLLETADDNNNADAEDDEDPLEMPPLPPRINRMPDSKVEVYRKDDFISEKRRKKNRKGKKNGRKNKNKNPTLRRERNLGELMKHGIGYEGTDNKLRTRAINNNSMDDEEDTVQSMFASHRRQSQQHRRLDKKIGTRTALVVIVKGKDNNGPLPSEAQLASDVFGIGAPDPDNLVTRYAQCSGGKLTFQPAQGAGITNGVTSVGIPMRVAQADKLMVENAARKALASKLGLRGGSDKFLPWDHVMFVWLFSGRKSGWRNEIAYGAVNGKVTGYRHNKISSVLVQTHEIGHNLGMSHSGRGKNTYGDPTDYLGDGPHQDDAPRICFNGSKSWYLGWYSATGGMKLVKTYLGESWIGGKLSNVDDYLNGRTINGQHNVVARIAGPDPLQVVHLMFNRAKGVTDGVPEFANTVTVVRGPSGGQTWLLAALTAGQSYRVPAFNGASSDLLITVTNIVYNDMGTGVDYAVINASLVPATAAINTGSKTPKCGLIKKKFACNKKAACKWSFKNGKGSCSKGR